MRIDWHTLAVAMLVVLGHLPHARGQWDVGWYRSQREVRSLFGSRSLGFPVAPKPRDFGGGGAFGPRRNFRRGFTPIPDHARWEDAAPEPAAPYQDSLQLGQTSSQPVQPAVEWVESVEQSVEPQPLPVEQGGQAAGQTGQRATETSPVVTGPGKPSLWNGLLTVTRPGGVRRPAPNSAAEATVGTGGPGLASGTPGEMATRRPSFQWNTDTIRRLPADVVLAERLRRVLTDRLRSPLEVSIQHETAILRGTVATEHDRILAGHLARFEPGVRNVKNELTVAAASSGPSAEMSVSPSSPN